MYKRTTTFALIAFALLVHPLLPSPASATPSPDFDGNGKVEIADFLAFVNVFGSSRGDGTYQAKYDLDSNGTIDIPDFLIFVDNFGKDVPPANFMAGPIRRLTNNSAHDTFPAWSPDGQHIAFMSDHDGNNDIYVIGSDGSNPRNLTNHSVNEWHPSWSPDGQHIAFERGGRIYVMGSDGSNPRRLPNSGPGHSDTFPSWSPDGQHIAFRIDGTGNREIYVMGLDGSNPRNLTNHSASDVNPWWSPDGQHIAFFSNRDGNSEIYVMGSDGSNPRNLTSHSASDVSPSWSPDGRHIAFASDRDGNSEIYVMGSDGSNPRNLTNSSTGEWFPSWSPDGRHIAFVSDRAGNAEIYVMELLKEGDTPRMTGDEQVFTLLGGASVEMVYIEPGTFDMGSPASEEGRHNNEGPVHSVRISEGFYLGKYEVTQGQWEAVMGTRPWADNVRSEADYPAIYISWEDAQAFIGRLNASAGSNIYRLPSEAEWEYACRASTSTRWSFGDDASQLTHYAYENYEYRVGTKQANSWGLYDMHGYVWEWVQDWYGGDYYSDSPSVDPPGPSTGSERVVRGGDMDNGIARRMRSAGRGHDPPSGRYNSVGFRLLRQAD